VSSRLDVARVQSRRGATTAPHVVANGAAIPPEFDFALAMDAGVLLSSKAPHAGP
jgi:hypothetical protein